MFNAAVKRGRILLISAQLLIVVAVSVFVGRLVHFQFFAKQARVGGPIPYTVVLRQNIHESNGTVKELNHITEAFRSDGSRSIQLTPIKDPFIIKERRLTFASADVTLNEETNLKTTEFSELNIATIQRDPSSKCINSFAGVPFFGGKGNKEVINGEEIVSGYRTVKISDSSGRITTWHALDYGCAAVKKRADFGRGGLNEYELIALIPGEPDPALFNVPAEAKEVPPSVRITAVQEMTGKHGSNKSCAERNRETLRKLDESYYKSHPPAK